MGLDDPLQALLELSPWALHLLCKGSFPFSPFPPTIPKLLSPTSSDIPLLHKKKVTRKHQLRPCAVTGGNTFIFCCLGLLAET